MIQSARSLYGRTLMRVNDALVDHMEGATSISMHPWTVKWLKQVIQHRNAEFGIPNELEGFPTSLSWFDMEVQLDEELSRLDAAVEMADGSRRVVRVRA